MKEIPFIGNLKGWKGIGSIIEFLRLISKPALIETLNSMV